MGGFHLKQVPPEMIQKYGNMNDWRNSCGTGPFILVDYVTDSSCTLVKNPSYWGKDPIHLENQLPYLDSTKILIIPDLSTRLAAMRTAKIDWIDNVVWEDADQLKKTSPQLKYLRYLAGSAAAIHMRVDKPELPFYDIRVRRALNMAVDKKAIAETYYGGNAELLVYPVGPIPEFMDMYTPVEKLPESTRELFEYHPDKAKQLLAEAGYPNGFKTEVVCYQTQVDLFSIVRDYWAKIGVELKLDLKDYAAWHSILATRSYKYMHSYGVNGFQPFVQTTTTPGNVYNASIVNDPRINEAKKAIDEAFFDEAKRRQVVREIAPYILAQAFEVQLPGVYIHTFWQPWVKGYNGEYNLGYAHYNDIAKYLWVDQDLKEKMTGKR